MIWSKDTFYEMLARPGWRPDFMKRTDNTIKALHEALLVLERALPPRGVIEGFKDSDEAKRAARTFHELQEASWMPKP